MSVTIDDKVDMFSKMIFKNIEEKSLERRQRLVEKYELEMERLEKEVEQKKAELIKSANERALREQERFMAQLKSQEQRRLVESKQKFIDQVLTMLYGYAERLAASKDYEVVLSKAIDNVSKVFRDSKLIYFYVLPNEFDIFRKMMQENITKFNSKLQYAIEATPIDIIGGLIAKDKEKLLEIDLTLKNLVEEHRDAVGTAVTRKFNEVSSK